MEELNNIKIAYNKGYRVTKKGDVIGLKGEILSTSSKDVLRYCRFSFRNNGKKEIIPVHRLQAYQKFGDSMFENGIMVRHLDGNHLNNSWDNIAIGTNSDNQMDIPEDIRLERALYATSFVRKYDKDEVRQFHSKSKSYKKTMKKFNISSKGTLHFILNN